VEVHSRASESNGRAWSKEGLYPAWVNAIALLIWLLAGAVAFLPFAFDTSPWDALTLRVPGIKVIGALSCRCSLLSSLSDDMDPSARVLFIAAIDGDRTTTDLERRRFIDLRNTSRESPFLLHLAEPATGSASRS